jgi:hypothetical protein
MKKVRKNAHKKINAILESVTEVKVYSLDNNFSGEIIGLNKEYFLNQISNFGAALMDNENGTFTLDIHSNLWYTFSTQVIETVEVVTEQIEVVETIEESAPVEQIEVREITFLWSESPIVKNDTTVNTFAEAESIIFEIACNKKTGGYDKTQFKITWVDGHTYTGRIDVLRSYTSGKELRKHIEDHCTFFAGLRKAYHETIEEYENTLRAYGITEEDKQEYKLFLDTYLLEDIKAPVNNEKEIIEIIEEVVTTPETKEETTNDNEITFQTGTGLKGNGIEITFTSKPSEDVRNLIKSNGYRWAGKNRSSVWWAILNDETLSIAEQLAGNKVENTPTLEPVNYPEIEIDDNDSYIISQSLQDREHNSNWVMRKGKKDHNKEVQEYFTELTNEVKKIILTTENEYYIYKLKKTLQYYKKHYFNNYVSRLENKANNPSWVTTGSAGRNRSRDQKYNNRYDKLMQEWIDLDNDYKGRINTLKNKIKRDKESALKEQLKQELSQPLPELTFKTVTKEFDLYGNGSIVKTRFYECEGYSICKVWGAFRVFETSTGKEIHSTKSNGTLQDAKAYVSLMIKKQIAS